MPRLITLAIDLLPEHPYHRATVDALQHAIGKTGVDVEVIVEGTDRVGGVRDGIVMGPGTPYTDPVAAEDLIRSARAGGIPLVAT